MLNITPENAKKLVKALAKKAYPDYTGRKFRVCERKSYYMSDYWDSGSRNYCVAVNLSTGEIKEPSREAKIPWNNVAHASFDIPAGIGILERSIFCGKEIGITLYVAPTSPLTPGEATDKQLIDFLSHLPALE